MIQPYLQKHQTPTRGGRQRIWIFPVRGTATGNNTGSRRSDKMGDRQHKHPTHRSNRDKHRNPPPPERRQTSKITGK